LVACAEAGREREASPGAYLTLDPDRTLSGHTGCNRMSGRWVEADGNLLLPAPLVTTRMACKDATRQAQERLVTSVLGATPAMGYAGNDFTLTAGDGRSLRFHAG
jgi:heat shock protein HslJ